MSSFNYQNSTITKYRAGTSSDPYIDITESKKVINGVIQLNEIPVSLNKVRITGYYEVPTSDTSELTSDEYRVDYSEGLVYFHSVAEGLTLTAIYRGRGNHYVSSGRIWVKESEGNVVQTLKDIITDGQTVIDELPTLVQTIDDAHEATADANIAATNADVKTALAVTATTNANTATSNANTATSLANTATTQANAARDNANSATSAANTAKTNADAATALANTATANADDSAENADLKAIYALEQGDYAKAKGDYAAELINKGDYNNGITYKPLNIVVYNDAVYQNILQSTGVLPTNTTYWKMIMQLSVSATWDSVINKVDASTTQKGIVQLTDSSDSTSLLLAPTANALKTFKDSTSAQLAETTYKTEGISRINVKKYGAVGDGTFHSIASKLPNVTLAQVQSLNPIATLNNSVDWYAIQLVIFMYVPMLIPRSTGKYIIDLPLVFNSQSNINGGIYLDRWTDMVTIKNIGVGTHGLVFNDQVRMKYIRVEGSQGTGANTGSGLYHNSGTGGFITDCSFDGNGRYGIEFSDTDHAVAAYITRCNAGTNTLGGIYEKSSGASQKNLVVINECYVGMNGRNSDGSTPTSSMTTNGNGISLAGGIALSVINTVMEYNYGSGLYIESKDYPIFSLDVSGNHFEGNKYANFLVSNSQGTIKHLRSGGNYYAGDGSFPNSLIGSFGYESIVTNPERLEASCSIDEKYGYNTARISQLSKKSSLKIGGDFADNYTFMTGFKSDEPLAGGYNCVRLDSTLTAQQESYDFATFVNPMESYRIVAEYRYKKTSSTSAYVQLFKLDKNKAVVHTAFSTAPLTGDDTWRTVDQLITGGTLESDTRYLNLGLVINGTVGANDYLLVRKVNIYKVDGVMLPRFTTASRPNNPADGFMGYDTTLNKIVVWNITPFVWKDAMGTTV